MATPVKISFSAELSLQGAGIKWPTQDYLPLSRDDLLVLYTLANHPEHRLNDRLLCGAIAAQLRKASVSALPMMPPVVEKFRDPTRKITLIVAELAKKTPDYWTELLAAAETLYEKAIAMEEA